MSDKQSYSGALDAAGQPIPEQGRDQGDGTYAIRLSGVSGGAPSTAGQPIGLLLILTKAS